MKSNALKLFIGTSIYLLLAGNTWSATIYQCVNEAKEISFSNQPCGESETLVKEHEIDENTNVIGSGATTQTPGTGTSTGTAPTAGTGSTTPAGGAATPAPAAGGGSRAGGGGGGSSAGGGGPSGPTASSDSTRAAQTTGTGTVVTTPPSGPSITDIQQPSVSESQTSEPAAISTETATAATSSESDITITSTKAQATSVSTPLASSVSGPTITKVEGTVFDDQIITIRGTNFSEKQRAIPLFFWSADEGGPDGSKPSPSGFKSAWGSGVPFKGERTQVIVAPGSEYAVRSDFGASDNTGILGRVDFDSDRLYFWRKSLDEFDASKVAILRTRFTGLSGPLPTPGQVITGAESGATGVVASVKSTGAGEGDIFFKPEGGTINHKTRILMIGNSDPAKAESISSYENDGFDNPTGTPIATMKVADGWGTFVSFNNKIWRIWSELGPTYKHNTYVALAVSQQTATYSALTHEWGKPTSTFSENWTNNIQQKPFEWTIQEVVHQTSTFGEKNGLTQFIQDGIPTWGLKEKTFDHLAFITPAKRYSQLFQFQVSNGAQPNTWRYMDSLYVDDTWHRVILCSSPAFESCSDREIQLPTFWTDAKIQIKIRLGGLNIDGPIFMYVLDGENKVSNGFKVN